LHHVLDAQAITLKGCMSGGFMAFSMWCKTPGTFGPLGLNPLGMHPKLFLFGNMQYGSSTSSTMNMSEHAT